MLYLCSKRCIKKHKFVIPGGFKGPALGLGHLGHCPRASLLEKGPKFRGKFLKYIYIYIYIYFWEILKKI